MPLCLASIHSIVLEAHCVLVWTSTRVKCFSLGRSAHSGSDVCAYTLVLRAVGKADRQALCPLGMQSCGQWEEARWMGGEHRSKILQDFVRA